MYLLLSIPLANCKRQSSPREFGNCKLIVASFLSRINYIELSDSVTAFNALLNDVLVWSDT